MINKWLDKLTQRAIVDGMGDYRIHLQRGTRPSERSRWSLPTFQQCMLAAAVAVVIYGFSSFLIVAYAVMVVYGLPQWAALLAPVAALVIFAIVAGAK